MDLLVHFNCDNAAFDDMPEFEVARILRHIADRIESGQATGLYQNAIDINGNIVGTFRLK